MDGVGNESPPLRSTGTILGSFLRGRPRGTSQSHINTQFLGLNRENSPSPPAQSPPSPISTGHRRRPAAAGGIIQTSVSHNFPPPQTGGGLGLTQMLRRRRSVGTIGPSANTSTMPLSVPGTTPGSMPIVPGPGHRIRLVPHLDSRRSLRFDAICRDLKEGDPPLRIGRFTDRSGMGLAAVNALGSNKLAFKSKVVSRAHAEIWVELGGKFYIKDTKSSSGTFLNHVRLSAANTESRPHQIKDGDILQLGVDYQGGTEDIYKSVKIRIEVGREWQSAANAFNTNALKNLKTLAVAPSQSTVGMSTKAAPKSSIPDCCICLFGVTIRQALFIAPCSHTFHYKCIRPLLESHHPAFSCPLCRTFADLEDDVEVEAEAQLEEEADGDDDESGAEGDHRETTPLPPILPPVPAIILERAREAERERDAGAETEVEADGGNGSRGRTSRARMNQRRMGPLVDLMEPGDADGDGSAGDDDEEMIDLTHAQAQAQIGNGGGGLGGGALVVLDDDAGLVDDVVHVHGRVDSSEGEGSGSGEGSRGLVGIRMAEGVDDEAVGGKRKR